jgi:hypothetical protein
MNSFLKKYFLLFIIFAGAMIILIIFGSVNIFNLQPSKYEINPTDDGSLISEKPCGPPCYMGVTPGVTRLEKLIEILKGKDKNLVCTEVKIQDTKTHAMSCGNVIYIHFTDDQIIRTVYYLIQPPIPISEVIKKYGFPDHVKPFITGVHDLTIQIDFYYDKQFMKIRSKSQKEVIYHLDASSLVESVIYFDEERYKEDFNQIKPTPWKGFGDYVEAPIQ